MAWGLSPLGPSSRASASVERHVGRRERCSPWFSRPSEHMIIKFIFLDARVTKGRPAIWNRGVDVWTGCWSGYGSGVFDQTRLAVPTFQGSRAVQRCEVRSTLTLDKPQPKESRPG